MIKFKSKQVKKLLNNIMGQNESKNRPVDLTPPPNYDLPALTYHSTHGENITLTNDGVLATRRESYCKGILFSHRPVMVGERVCLRINELSTRWSGVIRVGFSNHDPAILKDGLPKYACPDLTNKSGYWAKALSDRCLETNAIIHYYVNSHGDVSFGINGGDLGIFFSGVDTRKPLWAMIDLYGNCTSIELVDPRRAINNFSRGSNNSSSSRSSFRSQTTTNTTQQRPWPNVPTHNIMPHTVALPPPSVSNHHQLNSVVVAANNPNRVDDIINQVSALDVTPPPTTTITRPRPSSTSPPSRTFQNPTTTTTTRSSRSASNLNIGTVPTLKYNQGVRFQAMTFHEKVGKNVNLDASATVAGRHDEEFAQGYVFTRYNITPGERIVIQVLANEDSYIGSLAFGLTNCSPDSIQVEELPEDSDLLLDRSEYWVVSKDVANCPAIGDELSFTVKTDGSVEFMRNNGIPSVFMHVDVTQQLWAFWDIYGHTSRIRILGATTQSFSRLPNVPESRPHQSTTTSGGTGNNSTGQLVNVEPAQEVTESEMNMMMNNSLNNSEECNICCEKPVDCAIYTCGHMCMCYECALQQWRGRGGGFCPICMGPIRDVIKTFRS